MIGNCACEDGCPSCVGAATPAFAFGDIDSGARSRVPDKAGALEILIRLGAAPPAAGSHLAADQSTSDGKVSG